MVAVLCILGAYALNLNMFSLYLMVPIGIIAFVLGEMKFPISPLVIGLVLGGMADESLRRALLLSEGSFIPMFERPVAVILVVVMLLFICAQFTWCKRLLPKRNKK
ncbi:hypothetical protein RS130_14840 [Paraglaciecola aquimarina]|uniref:Tricarboxylate transport membrane protein TctA n=1 Tax=Paraglaciecola aquimarina TaxID=1235557 RepID=A0ABU3SYD3_9ALTE|nr:hypothetical protein [Paraglaciecola aquimarina]MDU0355010.1 hypothetical protein [Paraglaciecola aquimarina]